MSLFCWPSTCSAVVNYQANLQISNPGETEDWDLKTMVNGQNAGGVGPSIRYPPWLTEDARKPPDNRRSQEPAERVSLLVEAIETPQSGIRLPIRVGELFIRTNLYVRSKGRGFREFSFIEFKAVVRCMIQNARLAYGIANKTIYRRNGQTAAGLATDEDEIVKQVREGMEEVAR